MGPHRNQRTFDNIKTNVHEYMGLYINLKIRGRNYLITTVRLYLCTIYIHTNSKHGVRNKTTSCYYTIIVNNTGCFINVSVAYFGEEKLTIHFHKEPIRISLNTLSVHIKYTSNNLLRAYTLHMCANSQDDTHFRHIFVDAYFRVKMLSSKLVCRKVITFKVVRL